MSVVKSINKLYTQYCQKHQISSRHLCVDTSTSMAVGYVAPGYSAFSIKVDACGVILSSPRFNCVLCLRCFFYYSYVISPSSIIFLPGNLWIPCGLGDIDLSFCNKVWFDNDQEEGERLCGCWISSHNPVIMFLKLLTETPGFLLEAVWLCTAAFWLLGHKMSVL